MADSTRRVRIAMWGKFLRYLDSVGVALDACAAAHVSGFIVHAGLEKEQGWRYVKLIERVYVHLNGLGINTINPARSAGKKGVGTRRNDPMRFLDNEERHKLTQFLAERLAYAEDMALSKQIEKMKKTEYAALWAGVRDAAVGAVLVGAGLKVGEFSRLFVNCTCSDFSVLTVPRSGFDMERRIPVMPLAQDALRIWMMYREEGKSAGRVLFPAVVAKRRDDQRTQTASMHPATLFRRVKALFVAAGIHSSRACAQTLRNTYAAQLIESGADDQTIFEALGYKGDPNFAVPKLRSEHAAAFNGRV